MTNTQTLTIGQTQYPTVRVGDHSFANIVLKTNVLPVPPGALIKNTFSGCMLLAIEVTAAMISL
jgi:hypothetical protein